MVNGSKLIAETSPAYRNGVLAVLVLVYVFNFLDRQVLAILAEDIKHDIGVGDAGMGFLLGTAFAVFYAVFGIPLGRAADVLSRTKLIAIGLAFWSLMTTLSGTARGFTSLAIYRMGVGVGEASASPAAYSLIYDYFPKKVRTTVLAFYSSGIFIGAGLGLGIGGVILTKWKEAFPDPAFAPFGLAGWQAAFIIVGLPGILLAIVVSLLKEPMRGASDGVEVPAHPRPFRAILAELVPLLPGSGIVSVTRIGGFRSLAANLVLLAIIAFVAWALVTLIGGALQWVTLGFGFYAFLTWLQYLHLTDQERFDGIFRCKPLVFGSLGFAGCFFLTAGALGWLAVFFQRVHGASPSEAGLVLGASYAVCGFLGVILGGVASDRLVERVGDSGRLIVAAVCAAVAASCMAALLLVEDKVLAYALTVPFNLFSAAYVAPGAANVNSHAPPQMRATASAAYIVCQVFLGTALGPYVIGALSEHFVTTGLSSADALSKAMLVSLLATIPSVALLLGASRMKS